MNPLCTLRDIEGSRQADDTGIEGIKQAPDKYCFTFKVEQDPLNLPGFPLPLSKPPSSSLQMPNRAPRVVDGANRMTKLRPPVTTCRFQVGHSVGCWLGYHK